MKKILLLIVTFVLLTASVTITHADDNQMDQRVVTVSSDEVVDKDFYINAGDIVEVSGEVTGDVIIAGGQLLVDGVIHGDLLAAGGSITISGKVDQDVRVTGGQITISGEIGRNLTAAGGNIEVTDSATITGGAVFAGGNIMLSAPVGGDVYVGAGNLTLANAINGDVQAGLGALRLTSKADISGDLTYFSDEEPLIDESASVSGEMVRKEKPESPFMQRAQVKKLDKMPWGSFRLLGFIPALIFGLLLLRFYPNYTKRVAETLKKNPAQSMGLGFLLLVLVPIATLILAITLIGLPLSLVLGFVYIVKLYMAKIFVSVLIGSWVYARLGKKETAYLPFGVGLFIYYVVAMIPVLRGLVSFLTLLSGLGASYLAYKELHVKAAKAKLI